MKKYLKRIGTALLGITLAAASLIGCGAKQDTASKQDDAAAEKVVYRTVDEIKESGEINIGVFSDKSPFGYVDENGEYQGYDVYFGNRIGEDLGVKINCKSYFNLSAYQITKGMEQCVDKLLSSKQLYREYKKMAAEKKIHMLAASDYAKPSEIDQEHMTEDGHAALLDLGALRLTVFDTAACAPKALL